MVRIPLIYEEAEKRIYASATFYADGLKKGFSFIKFVVDTGSPFTLISFGESLKLQIPERILEFKENMGLGGTTYQRMMFKRNAVVYFKTDDEKSHSIPFKGYGVALPLAKSQEAMQRAMILPCILGLDFLKDNKLRLVCSPYENTAFLESI